MNLDPFSSGKDPFRAGNLNPAANKDVFKDVFADNSGKGGGLGRVRLKNINEMAERLIEHHVLEDLIEGNGFFGLPDKIEGQDKGACSACPKP